tara:strand:- start:2258 stop:3322 length:1065 start_codon:yes stop_codon:yes gene_type:complete
MVARETNLVNAFETTLAAQLASGGSTMNLADDPGVDSPAYFVIDPDNDSNREVVLWSSGTNHAAATVTRDIDSKHGTDPTHASGTKVRLAVVKQHIEEAHDAIQQGFILEDGDGTEVTINPSVSSGVYTAREVKFVEGAGIDINWTDTDNGTDADPYDLTFTVGGLTTSEIAAGSLVTESETITSNDNDTTIPTSAAVKNYADSETATLTNKTLGAVTLSGAVTGGDQEINAVVLKDYAETDVAVTSSSGVVSINLANGNTGSITLTENITDIDFTNVPSAGVSTFTLQITQHASSAKTVAINAVTVNGGGNVTAKTAGGGGYTVSTGANAIDLVTFLFLDAGTPLLNALQDFS